MAIHRVAHDLRAARERGGMDNGLGRTEHPLVGIASFDPRARLVARYDLGIAQGSKRLLAPGGENRRCALEHVHQRALAELETRKNL
jgi:hypothetical protein